MVEINFEAPKVQEYCDLRLNAGMSPKSIEAAERGYPMPVSMSLFMMTISSLVWGVL